MLFIYTLQFVYIINVILRKFRHINFGKKALIFVIVLKVCKQKTYFDTKMMFSSENEHFFVKNGGRGLLFGVLF